MFSSRIARIVKRASLVAVSAVIAGSAFTGAANAETQQQEIVNGMYDYTVYKSPNTELSNGKAIGATLSKTGMKMVVVEPDQFNGDKSKMDAFGEELINEFPDNDTFIVDVDGKDSDNLYVYSDTTDLQHQLNDVITHKVPDAGEYLSSSLPLFMSTYYHANGDVNRDDLSGILTNKDFAGGVIADVYQGLDLSNNRSGGVIEELFGNSYHTVDFLMSKGEGTEISYDNLIAKELEDTEMAIVSVSPEQLKKSGMTADQISSVVLEKLGTEDYDTNTVMTIVDGPKEDTIAVDSSISGVAESLLDITGTTTPDAGEKIYKNVDKIHDTYLSETDFLVSTKNWFASIFKSFFGSNIGFSFVFTVLSIVLYSLFKMSHSGDSYSDSYVSGGSSTALSALTFRSRVSSRFPKISDELRDTLVNTYILKDRHNSVSNQMSLSKPIEKMLNNLEIIFKKENEDGSTAAVSNSQRQLDTKYTEAISRLNELMGSKYYLNIVENPSLFNDGYGKLRKVRQALGAFNDQLTNDIRALNDADSYEFDTKLSFFEKSGEKNADVAEDKLSVNNFFNAAKKSAEHTSGTVGQSRGNKFSLSNILGLSVSKEESKN